MGKRAVLIDNPRAWQAAQEAIAGVSRLAVDVEADGFHRYPERVSLIQLALPDGTIYFIDPLAVEDLASLGEVLADAQVTKVLHSGDYDLRSLDRDFGFSFQGLYDTAIAARFCGSRRAGLSNVLQEYLGLELDKPKRLQRLDWSARPLSAQALRYAAGDVIHLLELADTLAARLAELGRVAWVMEECQRLTKVRYQPPPPPEEAYIALPGAHTLSGRPLAVLRELFVFREQEARRIGRPPHYVLSNAALLALARNPRLDPRRMRGVGRHARGPARHRLMAALERGRRAPPVFRPRPQTVNPWTPAARQRLAALKGWRNEEARRLDLESGLIWPARHLKRIALFPRRDSTSLDEGDPPWVRRWQWAELGESLARFRRQALGDPV